MGKKTVSKHVTSNNSAAANPAAASTTQTASKSSILRSSFAPFRVGWSLFASVIQALDSQHIRIHDTHSGRLRCEHAIASKATINCLDWGYHGQSHPSHRSQEKSKKRKRAEQVNGVGLSGDVALAFGTSESEIQIYSISDSKIVGVLKDAHTGGIRDFKFVKDGKGSKAWSIGGDGKLVQWDLKKDRPIKTIALPNGPATAIRPCGSSVLCASHLAYLIDPESRESPLSYNASTNPVHTILGKTCQGEDEVRFLTVAEIDHFINVFDKDAATTLIGSLRTENEVLSADIWSQEENSTSSNTSQDIAARMTRPNQVLAVLNRDGNLEIFPMPFDFPVTPFGSNAESLKARMKQRSRKSTAHLRIVRSDEGASEVPLIDVAFQGSNLALAWVEGGVNVMFDTVRWMDEDNGVFLLEESTEIVKTKSNTGLGTVTMNGVKDMGKSHVDDSKAVVANGLDADDVPMEDDDAEVIEISSAEEESVFEEDEPAKSTSVLEQGASDDEDDEDEKQPAGDNDVEMTDLDTKDDVRGEAEPPSFGELMRAHGPEPINVPNNLDGQSLVPTSAASLSTLPSGMSLGTVLTQALRTNDTNLLETCFHTRDLPTVRATIERLDSSFATTLLQRLAERLHSRPGRAGSLMVWIQWTLVAHGGHLAGQPDMMRQLKSLHKVVKDRAGSLQSLLTLKGKLDMLEAQMNLRKSMLQRGRGTAAEAGDDEEAVIYVEGQEDDRESDDGDEVHSKDNQEEKEAGLVSKRRSKAIRDSEGGSENEKDDYDDGGDINGDMPTTNGILAEGEEAGSSDEDEEGMIDDEAESTDNDSGEDLNDDDVDHDSVDTESSEGEASPPPKRAARGRLSNGIGSRGH